MTLIARAIPAGDAGVDTIETVTPAIAAAWKAAGKRWVLRYALALTAAEVATITGEGLGLALLSYGRKSDFSSATGASDAQAIIAHLRSIGVPLGEQLTIGVDLEDPAGAKVADVLAYESGFAAVIVATGCTSGAYIGAGLGMTSAELYSMKATRYYKSGSRVVDFAGDVAEPQCGWTLVQGLPFNQPCGGTNVDFDCAFEDFRGRSWIGLYESNALAAIALSPEAESIPPPAV
ncbi:MAG TPA: glycoside hydrolase domain-containing protein [Gemmatimonadaceae bacterium]|jgi:hypothetical protein|nr:glycoside hydrolase domain-containing protein [Gemmatimonadaceae bacterium]